jgi:ferric-dicitrate binding protein FerR (iron transport regulator)
VNTPQRLFALILLVSLLGLAPARALATDAAPRIAPSGDLNVVGAVTVDGARAESGQTFFSGSTVENAEGAFSTVSLGKLGRVELAAESSLNLGFTEAGLSGVLTSGRVRVSVPAGVSARVVTSWGEVLNDPGHACLFGVEVRGGKAVISVQTGRAELHAKGETHPVGAGESASSGAGDARTQAGAHQNLSGGKKKGLFLALAGGIAAIIIFAITGKDENNNTPPPCSGPIIPSGTSGGPCG